MAVEIERKFLVDGEFRHIAESSVRVVQGYLSSVPERTVRVRVYGDRGFITIKGIGSSSGMRRFEWEKEISCEEAMSLLEICEAGVIDKTRHIVRVGDHVYEVDEFHGDNEGLVVAEIELSSEDESFVRPDWLGREVTGDSRYYNSMLSSNPFRNW
jgi:adenylate cyclase